MNASTGRLSRAPLANGSFRSVSFQERSSIGFQYHSSKLGRAHGRRPPTNPVSSLARQNDPVIEPPSNGAITPSNSRRMKSGDIKGEALA